MDKVTLYGCHAAAAYLNEHGYRTKFGNAATWLTIRDWAKREQDCLPHVWEGRQMAFDADTLLAYANAPDRSKSGKKTRKDT